jgi:predicted benzoate:H+ symporter BenE
MKAFYILVVIVVVLWVLSMASSLLALVWSVRPDSRRLAAAIVAACFALLLGYAGVNHFHLSYSQKTNGSGWSIDSRWFFALPLILGFLSLGLALWRRRGGKPAAALPGQ